MKRKIFINLLLVSLFVMITSIFLFTTVTYYNYYSEIKYNTRLETQNIATSVDLNDNETLKDLKKIINKRITVIEPDGTVFFDSIADKKTMGNHSDRPEFISALESGYGESTRLSSTLDMETYYYAVKLSNGSVLRLSVTINSVFKTIFNTIPLMIVCIFIVFVLSIIIARIQTKHIVKPINTIDLEEPEKEYVYEELAPLLIRIQKQNESINEYIDMLKNQQIEFSSITENMSEGFLVLDKKSNVLTFNKSATSILEINSESCKGQNILTLNRSENFRNAVEKAHNGKSSEYYFNSQGKNYILIANPVKDNENIIGVVLLMVDVTEKLERDAMRREFSANVSHELKTPLTSISGYAEIMKNGLVKSQDIQRFSEKIYTESKRLINLIEDIIKLSKLDEKPDELQKEFVDLYSLSENVIQRLSSEAEKKNIEICIFGTHCEVFGIRHILDEMIFNLCDNAIKYNKQNGKIFITIENCTNEVIFSVRDTGIGIPKDSIDRVFERFYRVDKSHSKDTGGTGLGLSIVKHGATLHNADIKIDSIVDKGTEIKVIFNKD